MASALLSHQSSTGFYKSPVCKGLIGSMFLTCGAIHVPILAQLRGHLVCEIPSVLISRQAWRLLFNRLTYLHSKDLICSVMVIYYFRIFERRMGSKRFSSCLLATCTLSTILEICLVMLLKYLDVQYVYPDFTLPPGLYGIIFPLFVYYFLDIPQTSVSHFLGIPMSGKSITYLLGLQIAVTTPATMCSSLCGLVAGFLYRKNFLGVKKWLVIPEVVAKVCNKLFGWLLLSSEPKYRQMGATIELQRQEQADLWEQQYIVSRSQDYRQTRGQGFAERLVDDHGNDWFLFRRRQNVENVEPSPENIRILVDMGFDQNRAVEALRSSSNDLETATSILLRQ